MKWSPLSSPPETGTTALIAMKDTNGAFFRPSLCRVEDGRWVSEATSMAVDLRPGFEYFWIAEGELLRQLESGAALFDLVEHLYRQRAFSERTFGPGDRLHGVLDHIRKELIEIERAPGDVTEWIDVVMLALDGAWRAGHTPEQIVAALEAKQTKNEGRSWPDWRTADPGKAIEHVRNESADRYEIPAFLRQGRD